MAEYINQMEPWIGIEEKNAMNEYLDSGGWLTEFKKTEEFEHLIAEYTGSKYVTVVSNGTLSLFVALMALGIGKEDEVIVPDYTMIATANAVLLAGAKPIFADIDPVTLCLSTESIEGAITERTKAIMLVSINGRSPDMNEISSLAKKHGLYLIEDAAQSLGSFQNSQHLGTFGEIGSFSFSTPKIITTGQGGAVVTDNEEFAKKIHYIKDFGRYESGNDYHPHIGFNFKFTDLQAVIGIEQMKKLDWRVDRKKEIFKLYCDLLADSEYFEFIDTDLSQTSPWFIDVLVNGGHRQKLIDFLKREGIGSRAFYPPIHSQPAYNYKESFPVTESMSERGLWLPSSSFLSDEKIMKICEVCKKFL